MENIHPLFKIAELIAKEKIGELTDTERELLNVWLAGSENHKIFYERLRNGKVLVNDLLALQKFDSSKAFETVEEAINAQKKPGRFTGIFRVYSRYAALAAVLVGLSLLTLIIYKQSDKDKITQTILIPGSQKAILISGNQQIVLNNSMQKQIIKNDLARVENAGSTLSYSLKDSLQNKLTAITYNTLITPVGGEYTVVLSDGTSVKLNAASRLEFPVVFGNKAREVRLQGEAYFNVAKSAHVPFIVKITNLDIKVYGTTFDVLAYADENAAQTTLLEGSVGIKLNNIEGQAETKIVPGEQFVFHRGTESTEIKQVNTDQYVAWTKGKFVFENESIVNILKVLARWYNFEFTITGEQIKKQRFSLTLNRYDNASRILNLISASSSLKFEIHENKITVSAK